MSLLRLPGRVRHALGLSRLGTSPGRPGLGLDQDLEAPAGSEDMDTHSARRAMGLRARDPDTAPLRNRGPDPEGEHLPSAAPFLYACLLTRTSRHPPLGIGPRPGWGIGREPLMPRLCTLQGRGAHAGLSPPLPTTGRQLCFARALPSLCNPPPLPSTGELLGANRVVTGSY